MTEKSNQANQSGCFVKLLKAIGVMALLLILAILVSSWIASGRFKERLEGMRRDIAELEQASSSERPVVFGEARDGNAVWDYQAIEWALKMEEYVPLTIPTINQKMKRSSCPWL